MVTNKHLHQSQNPPRSRRSAVRWVAPAAAAALAIGGGLSVNTAASAAPNLPSKTPEQLVAAVSKAKVDGLSGTVTESAHLGLPDLPSGQGSGSKVDFTNLLSGTHTLRVWQAGKDESRVTLLGDSGESSMIRNGNEAWSWSSGKQEVHHTRYAPERAAKESPKLPSTPQEAAKQALDEIGPTTGTDVARNVTIAGRPAYELVLTPKDDRSLLTEVRIAVDAETSVPLRVEAQADGQSEPAFSVAFTSVDFEVPPDDMFTFTPPAGAKVIEEKLSGDQKGKKDPGEKKVVGKGWTSVTITDTSTMDDKSLGQLRKTTGTLPKVSGTWGTGRLLAGSAFSAVITDDGRVAVGAVKPELIYTALEK